MAGKERDFSPSSGWEESIINHANLASKIISLANKNVSLDVIFSKFNLQLEQTYSATGWAWKGSCPFPDHNDKRPSFGYNPNDGLFNCFGCHRGGKAVEFIAYMSGKSKLEVARDLLRNYSDEEILLHNSNFDFEKLQELLFDFADAIRAFKIKHNNDYDSCEYAKAVSWNLDVYLQKHAPQKSIIIDDLEVRVSKLKEQLEAYGD